MDRARIYSRLFHQPEKIGKRRLAQTGDLLRRNRQPSDRIAMIFAELLME